MLFRSPKRHLKLSLSLLRARRALSTHSFEALSAALKSVSLAIPSELGSVGSFVPILDRLARDLVEGLGGEEMGRQARRTLSKEDAKALVGLRQRWSGKGKGREADSWVTEVRERVLRVRSFFLMEYRRSSNWLAEPSASVPRRASRPTDRDSAHLPRIAHHAFFATTDLPL